MPFRNDLASNPHISTAGFGKPGYCILCAIKDDKIRKGLTRQIQAGHKAPVINAWLFAQIGKGVDRRVIYNHQREHIGHPKDRLVGAVVARQATDPSLPQQVTEDEFLQRIIDAAAANMAANPESVSVDQGIKAAAAKLSAKASQQAGRNILFAVLRQIPQGTPQLLLSEGVVEGEVTEVLDQT